MHLPYSIRNLSLAALCGGILLPYNHAALLSAEYLRSLAPRDIYRTGFGLGALIAEIKDFLKDQNAWVNTNASPAVASAQNQESLGLIPTKDDEVPGKCEVYLKTTDGGGCLCNVLCPEEHERIATPRDDKWTACFLNGACIQSALGVLCARAKRAEGLPKRLVTALRRKLI